MAPLTKDAGLALLAARLRDDMRSRPLLLLGAGASVSSGVPSARACASLIARWHYLRVICQGRLNDIDVPDADVDSWLEGQKWYKNGCDLAENFPEIVENLLVPPSERARKLRQFTRTTQLSHGYRRLAELVGKGVFKTVLTTNFDECIPIALRAVDPLSRLAEVNRWPEDVEEFEWNARQIVWLHGRIEQYSDQNTVSEVLSLNPRIGEMTASVLRASPLVVVGYRGSEPSIMDNFLLRLAKDRTFFKHGIYWCSRDAVLHAKVDELACKADKSFFWIAIEDFDSLMEDLSWALSDTDFAGPSASRARRPWVDCIVSDSLVVFTWSEAEQRWQEGALQGMRILSATGSTVAVRNEVAGDGHRYAKVAYGVPLHGDFEAEIELSGAFLDLQL